MKTPPVRVNIYPNLKNQPLWKRLKVAWRIVFCNEFFPAPYDWYEKLYPLVSNEYSHFASLAVDKAEREFKTAPATQQTRKQEAAQWLRHYASAAKKRVDIPECQVNFLVEWWVLRRKGIL
ncbi:MAG: hypothetical protein OEW25_01450 [Nitrospira sp.]|nr:hypothetical protein [Nitrospira sp.]MDH4327646.1 hypothetical protein [Nitrospira sp.]MDH5251963.1 hypothetical protein [Nitrospira sp.]